MWRADRVHELVLAICAGTALVVKPGDSVWSFCEIGKKKSAYVQRGLVESVPKEGSVSIKDRDKPLYGVSFAGVTQVCIPLYLSTRFLTKTPHQPPVLAIHFPCVAGLALASHYCSNRQMLYIFY